MKKINFNRKKLIILLIAIIILIFLLISYIKIIKKYRNDRIFALEAEKYYQEVNNPIFKLSKIIIYSDANVEDLSDNNNLSNVNISQFTDYAIYIDNLVKNKELSEENTINRVYINNIGITNNFDENGIQKFSTKKIDYLGKYLPIVESKKEIEYEVIHKNSEKELFAKKNYFYTDCSEPLILSYVNEGIVKNKDLSGSGEKYSLNGSILKKLNIDLKKLNYKINFTINIENNLGEKYYCNCGLKVNLDTNEGIYSGYIMQIFDLSNGDYKFRKV